MCVCLQKHVQTWEVSLFLMPSRPISHSINPHILKCLYIYFSLETICMKCQILFSKKNKKNITKWSSAESAYSVVTVKLLTKLECWPLWLSWMRVRLMIRRLLVRPPPGQQQSFVEIDHEIFSTVIFFFFFLFLIWVLRPFQEYFTCIKPIVHQRWAKTGEPGGKTS